jgi:hypothetical protein
VRLGLSMTTLSPAFGILLRLQSVAVDQVPSEFTFHLSVAIALSPLIFGSIR